MSDKAYPVLPNFERVDEWNRNALVYHHGSLIQQSLKLFRHLGEISEGIQKMNNLDVAKGLGKYVVSLVGMASFAGINPKELAELYSESGTRSARTNAMVIVNDLAMTTVDIVRDLEALSTGAKSDINWAIGRYQVVELFARIKQLAARSAIVLDRSIENATNCLCSKTGALDKFGLFQPDIPGRSRMEAETLRMAVEPSGWTLVTYFKNSMKMAMSELVVRYCHEAMPPNVVDLVQNAIDQTVENAINKYIGNRPRWCDLLTDRRPGMVVSLTDDKLFINPNEDLLVILSVMQEHQAGNPIMGLAPKNNFKW